MSERRSSLRILGFLLGSWPSLLFAQTPAGPEFRVNTYTTGQQDNASVASDAAGISVTFGLSLYGL